MLGGLKSIYNIKNGQNTVLRGFLAEEFARYMLVQKFPLLIVRPRKVIELLVNEKFKSRHLEFLIKYQQTMDFIGFGPIIQTLEEQNTLRESLINFFYAQDGLTKYFDSTHSSSKIEGYLIEVKSRTSENYWKPFNYSFSVKQEEMFEESRNYNFNIIICGVTFEDDWNLGILYTDRNGKILPSDLISKE